MEVKLKDVQVGWHIVLHREIRSVQEIERRRSDGKLNIRVGGAHGYYMIGCNPERMVEVVSLSATESEREALLQDIAEALSDVTQRIVSVKDVEKLPRLGELIAAYVRSQPRR